MSVLSEAPAPDARREPAVAPLLDLPGELTRRKLVLPIAWDVTGGRPVGRGSELRPRSDLVTSDDQAFALASRVRYRREAFGCIIQRGKYFRMFNRDAAALFEKCARTATVRELAADVAAPRGAAVTDDLLNTIRAFVGAGLEAKLLVSASDRQPSRARCYFVTERPEAETHMHMPMTMELEITNKCFRHCSYCAYESGPNPKIKQDAELSTAQWLAIIDECEEEGLLALEFTGGDPFVRADALEIIHYADEKRIPVIINSDLSVLKEHHLEGLAALEHLVAVQTSLDGATSESCDFTRGRGGFKTLTRQLARLREAELPVSVGTTIHRKNYMEVRAIAEVAAQAGAQAYYIGPMYPAGRGAALTDLVVQPGEWDLAVRQYMDVVRTSVIAPTEDLWYDILDRTPEGENPIRDQVFLTSRADRGLRIDPLGNAYVTAKLRQWHPRFWTVGSLTEFSVRTIWHDSRLLNELRSYSLDRNYFNGLDVREIAAAQPAAPAYETERDLEQLSITAR